MNPPSEHDGLQDGKIALDRRHLERRRLRCAVAAARLVGRGDAGHDRMACRRQRARAPGLRTGAVPGEGDLIGSGQRRRGPRHGAGLALAQLAQRRARSARVVRSRISTPSRWSSSCWMTRASKLLGIGTRTRLAARVLGPYMDAGRALDRHVHAGHAEAALVRRHQLVAVAEDSRVHRRDRPLLGSRHVVDQQRAAATPSWVAARPMPGASCMMPIIRSASLRRRRRTRRPRARARAAPGRRRRGSAPPPRARRSSASRRASSLMRVDSSLIVRPS